MGDVLTQTPIQRHRTNISLCFCAVVLGLQRTTLSVWGSSQCVSQVNEDAHYALKPYLSFFLEMNYNKVYTFTALMNSTMSECVLWIFQVWLVIFWTFQGLSVLRALKIPGLLDVLDRCWEMLLEIYDVLLWKLSSYLYETCIQWKYAELFLCMKVYV